MAFMNSVVLSRDIIAGAFLLSFCLGVMSSIKYPWNSAALFAWRSAWLCWDQESWE